MLKLAKTLGNMNQFLKVKDKKQTKALNMSKSVEISSK